MVAPCFGLSGFVPAACVNLPSGLAKRSWVKGRIGRNICAPRVAGPADQIPYCRAIGAEGQLAKLQGGPPALATRGVARSSPHFGRRFARHNRGRERRELPPSEADQGRLSAVTITVLSFEPEANSFPSGENATAFTSSGKPTLGFTMAV